GTQADRWTSPSKARGARCALVKPSTSLEGGKAPARRWNRRRRCVPSPALPLPSFGGVASVSHALGAPSHTPPSAVALPLTSPASLGWHWIAPVLRPGGRAGAPGAYPGSVQSPAAWPWDAASSTLGGSPTPLDCVSPTCGRGYLASSPLSVFRYSRTFL